MCKYSQLDLAVVRINKRSALFADEEFSHVPSKLRADGDILQIWFRGGYTSRSGLGLLENGVNAAVCGDCL